MRRQDRIGGRGRSKGGRIADQRFFDGGDVGFVFNLTDRDMWCVGMSDKLSLWTLEDGLVELILETGIPWIDLFGGEINVWLWRPVIKGAIKDVSLEIIIGDGRSVFEVPTGVVSLDLCEWNVSWPISHVRPSRIGDHLRREDEDLWTLEHARVRRQIHHELEGRHETSSKQCLSHDDRRRA